MWVRIQRLFWIVALLLIVCSTDTWAAPEDICPGGSSPRADIQWCADFENLTNCITGQETACRIDNGVDFLNAAVIESFKILPCEDGAAVGLGCMFGSGKASGTGAGFSTKSISGSRTALNERFYVKFKDGWMQNQFNISNHAPGFIYGEPGALCSGASCCNGYISWDWTLKEFRATVEINNPSTCGVNSPIGGSYNINANLGDFEPQNNVWYLFEVRAIMNTTATGTGPHDGNGIVEIWVDGVKILSYTDLNIRGSSTTSVMHDTFLGRSYIGLGVPRWEPTILYDAFVLSNNATYIGASANTNPLGTPDPLSPYWYAMAGDGAEQMKLSTDCSVAGAPTHYPTVSESWKNGVTYVTSPDNNAYACQPECVSSGCTTTNSMKATTTGANQGAGVDYYLQNVSATNAHALVQHGFIYLPSSNSYSTVFPWAGFSRYCSGAGGGSDRCYLALTRISGNWALTMARDNVVGTSLTTAVPATLDTWHEYQIIINSSNEVSLYIDGTYIIDEQIPSQDVSTWAFDGGPPGAQYSVFGIIARSPAGTFTLYYDDMDTGGASFVDCREWGTSCPFPAPPSNSSTGYFGRFIRGHRR